MAGGSEVPEGTVTVLFTDLVESTSLNQLLGDEEARAIGRATERLALERIEAHRGVVVKELGDGLMAVFSSARRAVACAREIQLDMARRNRREPDKPVHMRIGLHTGEVIEENGDIHGETVIIARRLEGIAPTGGIFASESVHMVLGTARGDLEDRGLFELKGIAAPWRVYAVPCLELEPAGLPQAAITPYVGRVAERAVLADLVARVADGAGRLVLIAGEAGAGKTRLASEALDEARRRGMNVLTGACLDMEVLPPYQPLIDQLEQATRQTSPERMREILGENAPEVATLMPSLRQRYHDIDQTPDLPPEQERRYVLHGMQEFLRRAAQIRPQVLLYEDLHWADESTLLLLEHLVGELANLRILVIGTYRTADLSPDRPFARSLAQLNRHRAVTEIRLRPLDRDEVAELFEHRVGARPPQALIDLIDAESDGNPLFAEETVRHLLETGKLFDDAGAWRDAVTVEEAEVPRTLAMIVGRRLDVLQPATRRVLAAAAVIGRVFTYDLLAAVSATEDDALFDALEDAERHHIIVDDSRGGEARSTFVHEQFRQVVLQDFSLPRRQRLHLVAADALAATSRPGTPPPITEIANHLELAGSASPPARTAAALVASARAALAALAFEDAFRLLGRAAAHIEHEDPDVWATTMALQASALRGSGQVAEALDALDVALGGVPSTGPTRSAILLQRAQLLLELFRAEETLDDLSSLVEQHRFAGNRPAQLDALLALGRANWIMSLDRQEFGPPARAAYEEALRLAEELADHRAMVNALTPTVWFVDYWPDYAPIAHANGARAVELARELGDPDLLIDAEFCTLRTLRPEQAAALAEDLLARLEVRRDPIRLKEQCFWMMWVYFGAGQFERCVTTCDRGIELAAQLGSPPVQYGSIKAMALTRLGRFDEVAHALAQEVTDDAHPFGRAHAQLARTDFLVMLGALDEAIVEGVAAFDAATNVSRAWMQQWLTTQLTSVRARLTRDGQPIPPALASMFDRSPVPPSRVAQAELALCSGDAAGARDTLRPLVAKYATSGRVRELIEAEPLLGAALLSADDPAGAAAVCRDALGRVETLAAGAIVWKVRLLLALAAEASGDSTTSTQQRALAAEEFGVLRDRIADPAWRVAFERQWVATAQPS